jgi:hypothetical protein
MTREVVEALLKVIDSGAPYAIAARACGINPDTFYTWKREFPEFADKVETVAARAAVRMLKKIEAHGEENFASLAWLLERRFPHHFARPEIQMNAEFHHSTVTHNSLTITAELAQSLEARGTPVREKVAQLFASRADQSNPVKQLEDATLGTVAEMKLPPLEMPAGVAPPRWWAGLVRGDNTREVERETAVKICRAILEDLFGKQRAQSTSVEFAPGSILLRDVHAELESLCGSRGWTALTKRGKNRKGKILLL